MTKGDALKGIAAVTAVISLFLGVNQVTGLVQKFRIHHKEFSETTAAGKQALQREDYPAAFESFKHAVELDPIDRQAQEMEAQAAMLWLENVHANSRSFTEISNYLVPVLDKSLSHSKGTAAADLTAHIGWANFLKYRDGAREGAPVEASYQQALRLDPQNVYAHAMWGHWILWQHGELPAASAHFSEALASGRVRPYVRDLQISALLNTHGDAEDAELFRVANEMRLNGEPIDSEKRLTIFSELFAFELSDTPKLGKVLAVLKREDAEATYDWLRTGKRSDNDSEFQNQEREFIMAFLKEISGDREAALSEYKALQGQVRPGVSTSLESALKAAIKRLSAEKSGAVAGNGRATVR